MTTDELIADGKIEPIKNEAGKPIPGQFRTIHTAKRRTTKGKLRGRLPGRSKVIIALGANKGYRLWS